MGDLGGRPVRQAVVIVHGMGEQQPLDTLNGFIDAALTPDRSGKPFFFSRPEEVSDSFESRSYLAPHLGEGKNEKHAQTEFFEYHWAHLMQGNRLDDLAPTFRRMLLRSPRKVPSGLRVVWVLFWALLVLTICLLWRREFQFTLGGLTVDEVVSALVGGGVVGGLLVYVMSRLLPSWLTASFVDVVRYLDTSPRSYEARRQIRAGIIKLLTNLHNRGDYDRIVVVAHSLGAFIAYDAIAYLWAHQKGLEGWKDRDRSVPPSLHDLEVKASALVESPSAEGVEAYRDAQRKLWLELREREHPWLVTDFVSVGTPMYFADQIYTTSRQEFERRVKRYELPTCPPQPEGKQANNVHDTTLWFSWGDDEHRELYYGAPFAVTRWTNMWFPAEKGFFGDWFGEALAPLFGPGVLDIPIKGNKPGRFFPGKAHAQYFDYPKDTDDESVTTHLRRHLDLASSGWLRVRRP